MEQAQRSPARRIVIHEAAAFPGMRAAGNLAARTLDMIGEHVRPGVSTGELDRICHAFILAHDAIPAPLNYRGFPKSICTSVNHVICHGIPSTDKILRNGDMLNIDVTVILDGWYGDTSRMFHAGEVRRKASRLAGITFECMWRGIEQVRPGARLGDIGHAIQRHAEKHRCSVVRDFCGHGIGQVFHDHPNVLHYGRPGTGLKLVPGMFFTIEPMINLGRPDVLILDDGWTAVTRDKSLSAQWEHTVAVTDDGCEVFTLSPAGHTLPPCDA
ncbi:MAG: type I methionyl aminopeptidase [Rhodospirillales bacterium]|nr:type I methionyl aminopeptidase [Rhodospirillales bacterium]